MSNKELSEQVAVHLGQAQAAQVSEDDSGAHAIFEQYYMTRE